MIRGKADPVDLEALLVAIIEEIDSPETAEIKRLALGKAGQGGLLVAIAVNLLEASIGQYLLGITNGLSILVFEGYRSG